MIKRKYSRRLKVVLSRFSDVDIMYSTGHVLIKATGKAKVFLMDNIKEYSYPVDTNYFIFPQECISDVLRKLEDSKINRNKDKEKTKEVIKSYIANI